MAPFPGTAHRPLNRSVVPTPVHCPDPVVHGVKQPAMLSAPLHSGAQASVSAAADGPQVAVVDDGVGVI